MRCIADTGIIVALLAADDPFHGWAVEAFREHSPFFTCEAVLAEACSCFANPIPVLTLAARGVHPSHMKLKRLRLEKTV